MDEGRCRSCYAVVGWVRLHPSGKRNPLNPEPDRERGNVKLIEDETDAQLYGAKIGRAVVLKNAAAAAERLTGRDLYLSHFATCPRAGHHRQRAT